MTEAPVQNKEADIFPLVNFLRLCSSADMTTWKKFIATENYALTCLPTILEALMLRRTKAKLVETDDFEPLPGMTYEIISVDLNEEEKIIYSNIMM